MKHFWINIDSNKKRYDFMIDQFNQLGLDHERISAVTPSQFDEVLEQKRPLTCKHPGCVTCEAEFACLCSHIKAMQEGLKTGDPYFVILEDDVYMPFTIDYAGLVKDIPDDTEILQMLILFGDTVINLFKLHMHTNQRYIKWQYLLPSTGFYLISREGAQKLVDQFYNKETNKYDFSSSPYQIVADVLLYKTANTYATNHPYAFPNAEMGSDIHMDHLEAQQNAVRCIKFIMQQHYLKTPFPYVLKADDPNKYIL